MQTQWLNFKEVMQEFKKSIERDLVMRRYRLWMNGQIPFEDRLIDILAKGKTQFWVSWRNSIKRSLDFVASVLALVCFSPLMALIAIAIKMDSKGAVFYKQVRVGRKGKCFNIYKFRTMRCDAETGTGPIWARENDPRVTRLGAFLRKTHLDELPQLINVIRGDMSIVGPRPERPHFVDEFRRVIPHYDRRLIAKPGITGLAQTKQRYDETLADVKRKLRYDNLYVEKMCPILDIKVIFATIGTVVFGTGR